MDSEIQTKRDGGMLDGKGPIIFRADRDAAPRVVNRAWLRDACVCDRCVDPSSGQKSFSTIDIPEQLPIQDATVGDDGSLVIQWKNDFLTGETHTSKYPRRIWAPRTPWNRDQLETLTPCFHYGDFMAGTTGYRKALWTLQQYGLIFLHDVPNSEKTVEELAAKLGSLQETFYGRTWDVKSKPNAENVAYTNSYLGLHQDLLYMDNVPRLQILHCLQNTCTGGESIFTDSRQIAKLMQQRHPDLYDVLKRYPLTYHYFKNGHNFARSWAVVQENGEMRWSPPFQLPAQPVDMSSAGEASYAQWLEAVRKLKPFLEDEQNLYEVKMQSGECVIFDNRRILHGRRQFDVNSGSRWLKGTYVDHDAYLEKALSIDPFVLRQGWHQSNSN
ncbi:Clavaminate synthase-like protein [Xylariaceae sp. FL0594]|nr:Clavaminate synthase-like protein [Xylariaceae sp. FL0594]